MSKTQPLPGLAGLQRIDVTRCIDIVTMGYAGGVRLQPGEPLPRGAKGLRFTLFGYGDSVVVDDGKRQPMHGAPLPEYKLHDDAILAAAEIARRTGAAIHDLT